MDPTTQSISRSLRACWDRRAVSKKAFYIAQSDGQHAPFNGDRDDAEAALF
jgi:hypothetical protein